MQGFENLRGRNLRSGLSCAALFALAACGGGGGSGSANVRPPDPPPAAPPPVVVVQPPNPAYGKHLQLTNTAAAHAAGLTGQGVRIGVVDSGVNRNHPALAGRVVDNLNYISSPPNNLAIDDVVGHGTAVSQIMAGKPFGAWPGGIAPGASIISARIISDKSPVDDGSGQGNEVSGALGLKSIHQDLINRGARIMNNSWGGLYWTNLTATAPIADEYRAFVVGNDGLVVFATGNSSFANPSSMAALPSQPGQGGTRPGADLERGWLAVAALDTDSPTQLASYSNACGVAMNYCLVAPGKVVVTGTNDAPDSPGYWNWSGTSLAAPLVSGAAALVWQAFPYFNNDLLRQTLLGTATDLGAAGVDATFGHGLLNVGAAIRGPARFDWGDVRVGFNGLTSTWSNPISGAGGLIKEGTGRLILDSSNTYTGLTQVLGGELRIPGNQQIASSVLIGPAGTLAGYARVGSVDNRGTLRLDEPAFRIVGDYTHAAGAQLALLLGAQLYVEGSANINGGSVHVLGTRSGYVFHPGLAVFMSAARINGQFSTVTSAPNVFLEAKVVYSPTHAWLDISRLNVTAAAQAMGLSAAAMGSAARVEDAFSKLDGLQEDGALGLAGARFLTGAALLQGTPTAAVAEASLSSLSGELHGADSAFAMMAIEGNRQALEARLDALQGATADRVSHGGASLHRASPDGAWAAGLDGQRALARFNVDANGWVLGQDRRVGDRWMLGAAFAQADGVARHDVRSDSERNRQREGQLYAQWQHGGAYLLGRFAVGRMQRSLQREILLGAEGFAVDSDYASRYATLGLQAGHRFDRAGATLTPYLGVQALRLDRDGFAEPGAAGFGLRTDGSTMAATQGLLGARFGRDWQLGAAHLRLQGRAEWQRTLSQSGSEIAARFTALDAWSPILGQAPDRDVGVFGIGLSTALPRWGRVSVDLDGRHERGQAYGQAFANWSLPF